MCGYVDCVPDCRGSVCCASLMMARLLPKHVGASMQNKGLVQSVNIVGHFYYLLFNSFKAREGIPVVTVNDFSANTSHFFLEFVSIRYFQF
jgi:hypothetical protein